MGGDAVKETGWPGPASLAILAIASYFLMLAKSSSAKCLLPNSRLHVRASLALEVKMTLVPVLLMIAALVSSLTFEPPSIEST